VRIRLSHTIAVSASRETSSSAATRQIVRCMGTSGELWKHTDNDGSHFYSHRVRGNGYVHCHARHSLSPGRASRREMKVRDRGWCFGVHLVSIFHAMRDYTAFSVICAGRDGRAGKPMFMRV
jgi:hypothetical protein